MDKLEKFKLLFNEQITDILNSCNQPIHNDDDMQFHVSTMHFMSYVVDKLSKTVFDEKKRIEDHIQSTEMMIRRMRMMLSNNSTIDLLNSSNNLKTENKNIQTTTQNEQNDNIQDVENIDHDQKDQKWVTVVSKNKKFQKSQQPVIKLSNSYVLTTETKDHRDKKASMGFTLGRSIASLVPNTSFEIAPGVDIPCVEVSDPDECLSQQNRGMVCYCPETKRFSICVSGFPIQFSMGNVLWKAQDYRKPLKTQEYNPKKYCQPSEIQNYYFVPGFEYNVKHPEHDQRNFTNIAGYCPTTVECDHQALRISDRTCLRDDILNCKPEDLRYAADYHAHSFGALIAIHVLFNQRI